MECQDVKIVQQTKEGKYEFPAYKDGKLDINKMVELAENVKQKLNEITQQFLYEDMTKQLEEAKRYNKMIKPIDPIYNGEMQQFIDNTRKQAENVSEELVPIIYPEGHVANPNAEQFNWSGQE